MVLCHLIFSDKWRNAFNSDYFNWFLFGSREFDLKLERYVLVLPDSSAFFDQSCNIYRPKKKSLKLIILEEDEQPTDITSPELSKEYCSKLSEFELDGYVVKYGCEINKRCYVLFGICMQTMTKTQEGKIKVPIKQIIQCDNSKIFCSSLENFGVEQTLKENFDL